MLPWYSVKSLFQVYKENGSQLSLGSGDLVFDVRFTKLSLLAYVIEQVLDVIRRALAFLEATLGFVKVG
jgi:hypothetical protein